MCFFYFVRFLLLIKHSNLVKNGKYDTSFSSLGRDVLLENLFLELGSQNRSSSLKMFTNDQKKFIVKAFGRNPSPTKVRRDFPLHFKIEGRAKLKYV